MAINQWNQMEFERTRRFQNRMKTKLIKKLPVVLNGTWFTLASSTPTGSCRAKCMICEEAGKNKLISGSIYATTNFLKHLKLHPEEWKDFKLFNSQGSKRHQAPSRLSHLRPKEKSRRKENEANILVEQSEQSESVKVTNFQWNLQSNRVLHQLGNLLESQTFPTDVCLYSNDGKCVDAHKMVLSLSSPYFQELFDNIKPPHRPSPAVVVLGNVNGSVLENLVKFMYSGKATVKEEDSQDFEAATRFYQIDGITSNESTIKIPIPLKKTVTVKIVRRIPTKVKEEPDGNNSGSEDGEFLTSGSVDDSSVRSLRGKSKRKAAVASSNVSCTNGTGLKDNSSALESQYQPVSSLVTSSQLDSLQCNNQSATDNFFSNS